MHHRVNITLPEETLRLIDRVVKKRNRSGFIAEAVKRYIKEISRTDIRKQIKEGAIRRADRDLKLAEEWFAVTPET